MALFNRSKTVKPDKRTLTAQVIHDNLSRFLSYMPNPDAVAIGSGNSYDTYREMRLDPRVKSLLNLLKTSALNFPIHIVQQRDTPDEVQEFINSLPIFGNKLYAKAKRILAALDYGFSVTEAVWTYDDDNGYILDNLITRKPERFVFDSDWDCYLIQDGERRALTEQYKWLQYQHDPDDENPYGTSVLRCVYWAWQFKRAGYEFWVEATEKFSVKSLIALFETAGMSDAAVRERANLISSLFASFESGSASAVANVKEIKEIGMSGSVADFNALVEACDVQIAYGLTGQYAATGKTDGGSYALSETQAGMLAGDAKGIALELQAVLQKAINWQTELRFGADVTPPRIEFDVEHKASFADLMSALDRGVPVSREAFYSQYGLPRPHDDEDEFIRPPAPAGLELADAPETGKKKPERPPSRSPKSRTRGT
jgi:phage gp29-like protein